jgi:hypothetical protein
MKNSARTLKVNALPKQSVVFDNFLTLVSKEVLNLGVDMRVKNIVLISVKKQSVKKNVKLA